MPILVTACALAWYHVMHVNLLVNIRLALFKANSSCRCCWQPINVLICKFGAADRKNGCQWLCRDRCFQPQTLLKTAVYLAFYIYAKYLCDRYANSVEKNGGEWRRRLDLAATT